MQSNPNGSATNGLSPPAAPFRTSAPTTQTQSASATPTWKESGRRLHVAVRQSLSLRRASTNLSNHLEPSRHDDGTSSSLSVSNIDQALTSLYSMNTKQSSNSREAISSPLQPSSFRRDESRCRPRNVGSSVSTRTNLCSSMPNVLSGSYLPQDEYDWILDGKMEWDKQAQESKNLWTKLEASSDWSKLLSQLKNQIPDLNVEYNDKRTGSLKEGTDVEGSEDFQPAETAALTRTSGSNIFLDVNRCVHASLVGDDGVHDRSSKGRTATDPELVDRVDELQTHSDNCTTDSIKTGTETPQLANKTEVARAKAISTTPASEQLQRYFQGPSPTPRWKDEVREDQVTASLMMPLTDLNLPEARFTRRRLVRMGPAASTDAALADNTFSVTSREPNFCELDYLPSYYFNDPEWDDTVTVLQSVPWSFLCGGHESLLDVGKNNCFDFSTTDWAMWDETMTNELCRLDSALQFIQRQLLGKVQPHHADLERANALLNIADNHLCLANLYLERSQQAIASTVGADDNTGLAGMETLLITWRQQEAYCELSLVLNEIRGLEEQEKEIYGCIDSFDPTKNTTLEQYNFITQRVQQVFSAVLDGRMARIECLDVVRKRLGLVEARLWDRLFALAETLVVRSCRQTTVLEFWKEYERLVAAALKLYMENEVVKEHPYDFSAVWVKRLLRAFCYEADRALAVSLLNPMDGMKESRFEFELSQLAREIDLDWGDGTKLRTMTHNLVTIRFRLEESTTHLSVVVQTLCLLLTDLLHAYFLATLWHRTPFEKNQIIHADLSSTISPKSLQLERMLMEIVHSKAVLWNHCESVLVYCIEEYLNFSQKATLFAKITHGVDDHAWMLDLQDLHKVSLLVSDFLALKDPFFEEDILSNSPTQRENEPSQLRKVLDDLFRNHLRSVHAEAMSSLGRLLTIESWALVDVAPLGDFVRREEQHPVPIEGFLRQSLKTLLNPVCLTQVKGASFGVSSVPLNFFSGFSRQLNPFGSPRIFRWSRMQGLDVSEDEMNAFVATSATIFGFLSGMCRGKHGLYPRLMTASAKDGLVPWVERLLAIAKHLPSIVEDVLVVVTNLCDLYLMTVLRFCCGTGKHERRILGMEPPEHFTFPQIEDLNRTKCRSQTGSTLFEQFHKQEKSIRGSKARISATLPTTIEGDICSPILKDRDEIDSLRSFVTRAHDGLRDIINLDRVDACIVDIHSSSGESSEESACKVVQVLEKRLAAAWSSFSVAALVDLTHAAIQAKYTDEEFSVAAETPFSAFSGYTDSLLKVVPTLVSRSGDISCSRSINAAEIVTNILAVGDAWEVCKLNEHPNNYVEDICEKCSLIWGFLCTSGKLSEIIQNDTWNRINAMAYQALLEGFARVPRCSTEGRALMTLDLASLSDGLMPDVVSDRLKEISLPLTPPLATVERGLRYVEAYIKLFYFPKEDVIRWIADNYCEYRCTHILALATAAPDHPERSPEMSDSDLLEQLEKIYQLSCNTKCLHPNLKGN